MMKNDEGNGNEISFLYLFCPDAGIYALPEQVCRYYM
jgi:hypothetical protein